MSASADSCKDKPEELVEDSAQPDEADEADAADRQFQKDLLTEQRYQFSRIVSGTRLHLPQDAQEIPPATADHLRRYVSQAKQLGVITAIAVNGHVDEVRRICSEVEPDLQVHILHVPCWGVFVPALNALLNFAQRSAAKYILFQSLEVCCTTAVLQKIIDHHDPDSLVVGPVFDGHNFLEGKQILDGRSSPWNTLALWSVRKLAMTGFLCIADGLPDGGLSDDQPFSPKMVENPQESSLGEAPMGSDSWWSGQQFTRQQSSKPLDIPAGVEEVTAIALLQHLHGVQHSRAVLLRLPAEMAAQLSWIAVWEKDEARRKWHQKKMASKVARPAAQLQELFKFKPPTPKQRSLSSGALPVLSQNESNEDDDEGASCSRGLFKRRRGRSLNDVSKQGEVAQPAGEAEASNVSAAMKVGQVMHYGESIKPASHVKRMCLAVSSSFYANSTVVLATAFRFMNTQGSSGYDQMAWRDIFYVAAILGGVYLPMPASLALIRNVTRRAGHLYGLLVSLTFLFAGHTIMVISQALAPTKLWPMVLARLVQGMGSAVLFQTRHILASVSTSDHHVEMQSWSFLTGDLALGFGALFPAAVHFAFGSGDQDAQNGALMQSVFCMIFILFLTAWVLLYFPRHLHFLPYSVRYPRYREIKHRRLRMEANKRQFRFNILLSGTARIFVQSAIVPVVAMSMRDARWTGNYRQTVAVAAIFLLPLPFEALVNQLFCSCNLRAKHKDDLNSGKWFSGMAGCASLLLAGFIPRDVAGEEGEFMALATRIFELGILMIALGMAAPINSARLYQQADPERFIVNLEWLKAYVGRLFGPFVAVLLYCYLGYGTLLSVLAICTAIVTLTA